MFRAAWRRGETVSRPEAPGDDGVSSERAVEWLRVLGTTERTGLTALLPENVPNEWAVARPTGVGRAITAYRMPIEGRDEWIAAVERLA